MEENLQQEVIETDFKEKKISRVTISQDTKPAKFLRDMAKISKEEGVKSVMVLTINEENQVDWIFEGFDEHHACLAALVLDEIKDDLKTRIFDDVMDLDEV